MKKVEAGKDNVVIAFQNFNVQVTKLDKKKKYKNFFLIYLLLTYFYRKKRRLVNIIILKRKLSQKKHKSIKSNYAIT